MVFAFRYFLRIKILILVRIRCVIIFISSCANISNKSDRKLLSKVAADFLHPYYQTFEVKKLSYIKLRFEVSRGIGGGGVGGGAGGGGGGREEEIAEGTSFAHRKVEIAQVRYRVQEFYKVKPNTNFRLNYFDIKIIHSKIL